MIECGIEHSGFSQGGIDSNTGKERESTTDIRTDFAEIPRGLQSFSMTVLVGRKIWNRTEQTYEYAEGTDNFLRYVYFYDENKNFISCTYFTKNSSSTINFLNYLGAKYVRFTVNLTSSNLYPDDTPDPKESYYFLENFSTNCVCVEWKLNENSQLIHDNLKIVTQKALEKPYPKALWRVKEGTNFPRHELMPKFAFIGMGKLKYIHIPENVRKIDRLAFLGTALESVRIHPECEFFETSFPENCVIEFYD